MNCQTFCSNSSCVSRKLSIKINFNYASTPDIQEVNIMKFYSLHVGDQSFKAGLKDVYIIILNNSRIFQLFELNILREWVILASCFT